MTVKSVSVVLMTLNERKNIEILVPRLESLLNKFETEIIIADKTVICDCFKAYDKPLKANCCMQS